GLAPRRCAVAFAGFVAAVRAWVVVRAAVCGAWTPISTTLPEPAIDKPCSAVALAPLAQPRVPPPPPLPPDEGLLVAVWVPVPVPEWTLAGWLGPHAANARSGAESANAAISGTPAKNANRLTLRTPDAAPLESHLHDSLLQSLQCAFPERKPKG